jgi:hypothetical protein
MMRAHHTRREKMYLHSIYRYIYMDKFSILPKNVGGLVQTMQLKSVTKRYQIIHVFEKASRIKN